MSLLNMGNWLGDQSIQPIDPAQRAVACWKRIQDRPTTLQVDRDGVLLAAQTVRIEYGETAQPRWDTGLQSTGDGTTQAGERDVWIIGVRDHPDATILDADIAARDRIAINYELYVVVDVILVPGEVQARCMRLA